MAFLDGAQQEPEDSGGGAPGGTPPTPGGGGAPGGGAPGGGGPILAALANRQRGSQVSAPGPGDQASSMTMIMQAIGMMQQALPGLMPGTPIHKDVLKAVSTISRHIPAGEPTGGVQQNQLRDLLQNVVKNALLSRIMGQQRQQPGQGPEAPAGPSPLPGASAQAPMPSTPLPGA